MTEMQLWFSEDTKAHQTNIYTLDVVNDTVIGGKHYYPLSIQEGDGSEVAGYLREEEKRVYFVYKGDREESLLYDFGMEVGSSVEVGRFGAQQLMTCVEVDSIYTSFGWLVIGNNRPDVQFDKKGIHTNVEYDTKLQSSDKHKREIEKNDPSARNKFYKLL